MTCGPIKCQKKENRLDLKFAAGLSAKSLFRRYKQLMCLFKIQNPSALENNKIMVKHVNTIAMLGHVNS